MRPRRHLQALDDLRRAEPGVHRQHQADGPADQRRGIAGAHMARFATHQRLGAAAQAQAQQAVVSQQAAPLAAAVVPAHGGNAQRSTKVRIAGLEAVAVQRGHAHHLVAAGGPRGRGVVVAGGGHHHHAQGPELVHRGLVFGVAGGRATKADVDDARRVGVVRRPAGAAGGGVQGIAPAAAHRQAGGPAHAVDDVAHRGAALACHPHRQQARGPVDAGAALAVVGVGHQQAAHRRAVPAVGGQRAGAVARRVGRLVGGVHAVTGVGRVGIAAVAIIGIAAAAGAVPVGHHVVAGQHPGGGQVGVGPQAGVQHRHHHTGAAGAAGPGALEARHAAQAVANGMGVAAAHRLQPPLLGGAGKQRVIRLRPLGLQALLSLVRQHPGHAGLAGQQGLPALGLGRAQGLRRQQQVRSATHRLQAPAAAGVQAGALQHRLPAPGLRFALGLHGLGCERTLSWLGVGRRVLQTDQKTRHRPGGRGRCRNGRTQRSQPQQQPGQTQQGVGHASGHISETGPRHIGQRR